jgi:hypothetical protein
LDKTLDAADALVEAATALGRELAHDDDVAW